MKKKRDGVKREKKSVKRKKDRGKRGKEGCVGGVSKLPYSKKNHKALTFTSQGFAMSKSCCTFRP